MRFQAGQLWIPLSEGAMPIVIRRSASGGFRVEFRLTLGMCEATDGDLQQFVAAVNADRPTPILEVREDGATELFWAGEFEQTVDAEAVVRGVLELTETSTNLAEELRERFFFAPPAVLHACGRGGAIINADPENEEPATKEVHPAVALVGELHDYLLSALVENFGEEVRVTVPVPDPRNGLVSYQFEINGALCDTEIVPNTGRGAIMKLQATLGRMQSGYGRALRWLGQNRCRQTVALAYIEEAARAGDLLVCASRNLLSGDAAGVRHELEAFCLEVKRAITGLKLWFPQFVDYAEKTKLEDDNMEDEKVWEALAVC